MRQPFEISRGSMGVAAFSTIVEWFDFTLYLYLATILSRVFFGGGETSLVTTLGGFAVAYLMRPFGAIVFGHIGDRYGRRRVMLLSMGVMTFAMLATALLPTHAQIGPIAGWLLILLRCVMGFSVGGEYTGVVAYLLEGARADRRGLITSLASAASEVGALLAVGVSALTVSSMSSAALDQWGWRIPFLVGAAMAASIWFARSTMQESPEFERQKANGTVPRNPLRHTLTHYRAGIMRSFAISALGSITYYVGITYVPAFLTSAGAMSEGSSLWLSTVAALVVILVTPLIGALSDRLGRKPVLIVLGGCAAVLPITMFSSWRAALLFTRCSSRCPRRPWRSSERGRCRHDRRAVPRRGPPQRLGVRSDSGHGCFRRSHALSCAGSDREHGQALDPRSDDRSGGPVCASGAAGAS